MWVLQHKSVGVRDTSKYIILMTRMEEKLTSIKLNNWVSRTVSAFLEERFGGKKVHIGTFHPIRDIVCWKGNRTVLHWLLYPVEVKCESWVIVPNVMLPSRYAMRHLLEKNSDFTRGTVRRIFGCILTRIS